MESAESEIKIGTLADFCAVCKIAAHAIRLDARSDRNDSDLGKEATHWQVTLSRPVRCAEGDILNPLRAEAWRHRAICCQYSMGSAHKHTPEANEVLRSLLIDASDIKAGCSFEEWASNCGYDTDSRKGKRIFKACKRVHRDLSAFLGDLYDTAAELAANE